MSSLKDTNVTHWWLEIKSLGGLKDSREWWHQLLCANIPSTDALAEAFDNFLLELMVHFEPLKLDPTVDAPVPVPAQFLVSECT